MKTLIILVLIAAVGIAGYLYFDPKLRDRVGGELRDIVPEQVVPSKPLYRWTDAQGVPQITDQPPPGGIEYELVESQRDVNVVPALRTE